MSWRPGHRTLDGALAVWAVVAIGLYSSYGRPIWTDEFLHFALGGLPSAGDAVSVIHHTTAGINFGQTGAYMFADFLLLKAFGASSVALRLPSLLSGVVLLISALVFLRTRGVGYLGQFVLLAALVGQSTLMYYVGEARPYMPLAASVVGVLAYYSIPIDRRTHWAARVLGWGAVVLGCMMHPYFPIYWAPLVAFCYVDARARAHANIFIFRDIARFINIPLAVVGSAIFVVLGAYTWMQG